MECIRRLGLKGTELARAQMTRIRLKPFKIGAVIIRKTRRIRFLLSSAYPYQSLFFESRFTTQAGVARLSADPAR